MFCLPTRILVKARRKTARTFASRWPPYARDLDPPRFLMIPCARSVSLRGLRRQRSGPETPPRRRPHRGRSIHLARNQQERMGQRQEDLYFSRRVPCAACVIDQDPDEPRECCPHNQVSGRRDFRDASKTALMPNASRDSSGNGTHPLSAGLSARRALVL